MKRQGRAIAVFFLSLFLCVWTSAGTVMADVGSLTIETGGGKKHTFSVELALTDEARARGLMYRRELALDKGMLFVFPDAERRSFWMKNTYIPLDIIFIRRDGRIANIVANAEPQTLTTRVSKGRASAVLEIIGGRAAELGIKAGDLVRHDLLGTADAK